MCAQRLRIEGHSEVFSLLTYIQNILTLNAQHGVIVMLKCWSGKCGQTCLGQILECTERSLVLRKCR
jgi:hypothetical protein